MTTTIVPASGQGILFAQQGPGTTPGYSALDDRRSNSGSLQEGVYGTATLVTAGGQANVGQADFMVTQRAAGANLSVDVNMPAGGFAYVQGDTINGQGLYTVPVHASNINELIATADVTNPRIDQVILEVQDNVLDASGNNIARTRVLTGAATVGATLANRTGAAALPGSALPLADVLVAANATTVPNSVIRDRRKWARGAYFIITRSALDYTTASGTFVLVDSTNLQPRIECSGAPLRAKLETSASNNTASDGTITDLGIDGTNQSLGVRAFGSTGLAVPMVSLWEVVPAAGSHLIGPMYRPLTGGTSTLFASAGNFLIFTVEEIVRQNAPNNVVTTG